MSAFRRSAGGFVARFDAEDAALLANIARQVAQLIADRGEPGDDPVLDRLLPDAYRDAPADAAEYRRFTEAELADDKIAGSLALADAFTGEVVKKHVTVRFEPPEAFAALRSLTDIRLALATRIGVDDDGLPSASGADVGLTFAIYNWLGGVQESLVRAVDR
ncbi:MAG TPA: DUF2017 family protein [Galbitalea sp.]|jgi:hypothetical protein